MMKLTHIAYPLCIITLLVALLPACSNRDAFEAMRLNDPLRLRKPLIASQPYLKPFGLLHMLYHRSYKLSNR